MIQITKMAGLSSRLRGDESSKKSLKGWLIQFSLILLILTGSINANGQALKYVGSTPSDGSIVQSLNTVELNFDISDIISSVGEGDWGICQNGFYVASLPQMEKSATLYKGTKDDGEVIERISTVCKPNNESFEIGNTSKFIFSEFELQAAQVYTLVITYEFYAGKKGEKTWDTTTKLSFQNDPLVLTFYGASQTKKVLSLDSSSIDESQTYEKIKDVKINFNYYVTVNNDIKVTVFEGNNEIVTSSTVEVDPEDGKSIIVMFPETPIYLGHSYNIVIPAEGVSIADEEDITNPEITIPVKGGSYLYFGIGRGLNPSDGSVSILDEITVPFRFPASDTKTYGIMDTGVPMTVYVYSGENTEGEELMRIEGNASTDGTSLVISPNYAFEPESEYTFVIPEGTIDVYDLGARNPSIQEEFVNERIELHYYTPSVDDLPKWHPTPMNVKNNEEISELKYFILDCPEYEYDEVKYNIVFNKNYEGERKDAALYKVTDTGEEELVVFNVTLKTLNANSEIGNGELDGSYFVGEVNQTLYEGNQYKLVWFANKFIVNNPFIGKYVGNPEISVTLKGATPTVNDFGLKANVADRLHSHADVFSFVTESEVMAGENAKMILKDGEDNVAEAPVYISREANGHRVYADFGGKKLESGKNYDVVLPEGSVYSADG
ncbi:MAG: hypothetical protein K2J87_04810, partial [Muribaculaceae bacterium]|nr:hypothetical protein [Muribaculaceae bacterium]